MTKGEREIRVEEMAIVVVSGIVAGTINTMVGGGSLITLPVLIFLGLSPAVANGTNRLSLVGQTATASLAYYRTGIVRPHLAVQLAIPALVASVLGALVATDLSAAALRKVIGLLLPAALIVVFAEPHKRLSRLGGLSPRKQLAIAHVVFFGLGFYGGFLGAGIGVLIMTALVVIYGMTLLETNGVKTIVNLLLSCASLVVFWHAGAIDWRLGVPLLLANSVGGVAGAHLAVRGGEKGIRLALVVVVAVSSVKLLLG
ncbi:MAG: sulfite exporter TauE/SafE family protein [Candidatus Schekmanbacteria bacterium]|nr:sulfite exporter TauE/SafE family protein [Candidatus Schekmanbacteria bacterium]